MHSERQQQSFWRVLCCFAPALASALVCACRFGSSDINIGLDLRGTTGHAGAPAGGSAPCSELWSTPVPLTELNTPEIDCGGQVSPDGRVYYFDTKLTGVWDLFVATRRDGSSAFGTASPITELNTAFNEADPTTTEDELEIYFTSDRDAGNCIYASVRANVTSPWEPATRLDALCAAPSVGPYITPDGLTLYYTRSEHPSSLGTVLVSTRGSRVEAFAPGAPIPALTFGDIAFGYPALSADGLTSYVSATTNELDIWRATRVDLSSDFASPEPIVELNSPALDGDPSVTADGSQLFFASARAGVLDLYVSNRQCR